MRKAKLWMNDPKYFKRVHISAYAAMKMLSHATSGVEKGCAVPGGKPVEVMGLLLGRPGTGSDRNSLVVTDSFALPIDGFETKVIADDQPVLDFMIELSETLGETRKETFMGWYHSHPFDVGVGNHCYLSTTDVQTELHWQRAEDPQGNPWVGLVIDPLRSVAKGRPEFGAFRAYPPEYNAPANQTPDGQIVLDQSKVEKWGAAYNRYHAIDISYFMAGLSSQISNTIAQNFLWKNALSTTPVLDREYRDRLPERIHGAVDKLESDDRGGGGGSSTFLANLLSTGGAGEEQPQSNLEKASKAVAEITVEQCQGLASQTAKKVLFG